MRLTPDQVNIIRTAVAQVAGADAQVWLFGSRVHDEMRGGDVDLLLDMPQAVDEPALLAASLSARVSRAMDGRDVDVVIRAPNLLQLPIHAIAMAEGLRL